MQYPAADAEASEDTASRIRLHESIADLLARRGQWRQAYEHLRHVLDLVVAEHLTSPAPPRIPEQYREEVDRLRREHAEAREQAIRDALTASYNRRYLDQRLVGLVEQQAGGAGGLAVALVDLDWFKKVNDTFGHQVGDQVLRRVVELLQDGLPETAFCARYGGEEFVLVLPGVDAATAVAVAEAARARVASHPWGTIGLGLRVTVSIGLAHQAAAGSPGGYRQTSPQGQLRHADGLLYAAKRAGRNAVAYDQDGQTRLAGEAAGRRSLELPNAHTH
jgi:diguanylate cyclase (GGDEF)-like protein